MRQAGLQFRKAGAGLRALAHFPMPNRAGWHQAIRLISASLLAEFAAELAGLPHGYWAVITCLIIVQGSLGATIAAGIARLAATLAGAGLGAFGVLLLKLYPHLPEWVVLLIVISPLAVLAASRPLFKMAPLTGALILLLAGSGDLAFALYRIAEIALGCVIGVLVSLFVLPERATVVLINRAAGILDAQGEFAAALLARIDPGGREKFELKMRTAFVQLQNDMKEVEHERGVRLLRSDPFPERLMRHLQRLRTDVNMLGRAVAREPAGSDHQALGAAIKRQFEAAAVALRGQRILEPDAMQDGLAHRDGEGPLDFALATLRHEFGDLAQTLQDRAGA